MISQHPCEVCRGLSTKWRAQISFTLKQELLKSETLVHSHTLTISFHNHHHGIKGSSAHLSFESWSVKVQGAFLSQGR